MLVAFGALEGRQGSCSLMHAVLGSVAVRPTGSAFSIFINGVLQCFLSLSIICISNWFFPY